MCVFVVVVGSFAVACFHMIAVLGGLLSSPLLSSSSSCLLQTHISFSICFLCKNPLLTHLPRLPSLCLFLLCLRERERERERERDWDPEGGKRETETETHRLSFGGKKKRGRGRRRELDCFLVGGRVVDFFALDFWLGSFAFSRAF